MTLAEGPRWSLSLAVTAAIVAAVMVVIARPLLFASIDGAVAAPRGIPVRLLGYGFLALVGAAAAEASQAVGALLMLGLLAAPAGTAARLITRPYSALLFSAELAVTAIWTGLALSYLLPASPPSFTILAEASGSYALALLGTRDRQRVTPSVVASGLSSKVTCWRVGEVGTVFGGIAAKAAAMVASGVAGAVVIEGAKRLVRARAVHEGAVWVASCGLRGVRVAETGAEKIRLTTADILSEARERIGEQSPPPGSTLGHKH